MSAEAVAVTLLVVVSYFHVRLLHSAYVLLSCFAASCTADSFYCWMHTHAFISFRVRIWCLGFCCGCRLLVLVG